MRLDPLKKWHASTHTHGQMLRSQRYINKIESAIDV